MRKRELRRYLTYSPEERVKYVTCVCPETFTVQVPENLIPVETDCPHCRQAFHFQWIAISLVYPGSAPPSRCDVGVFLIALEQDGSYEVVEWTGKAWRQRSKYPPGERQVDRWFELEWQLHPAPLESKSPMGEI